VAGHADAPVEDERLFDKGAGPVSIARSVAVEKHLGVEPARLGARDLVGEVFRLA